MERLLVIGSSGHAKVVIDLARRGGASVVGLLDDFAAPGSEVLGARVLGSTAELARLAAACEATGLLVAVGDNHARARLTRRAAELAPSLPLARAVHPAAVLGEAVELGAGSVVMAGAVVNGPARIGRGCILNTRCSLDHDGELGDFASLGPGATLGGGVRVGAGSAIGLGASVLQRVTIGAHTVVGAGALVLGDLPERVVAHGSPARVIRARREDEPYL